MLLLGFGFVSFETEEPAEKVCSIQYHDIKGKKVHKNLVCGVCDVTVCGGG